MPIPGQKTSKPKEQPIIYGQTKWICPKCGAVHYWDFSDGCHAKCGHKGRLERKDK